MPDSDVPTQATAEITFTLDGRPATARRGEVIIAAAERAGVFIPRFCYHPRMKPVGMCRMCLVEVSGPRGATLQPACFVTATEGMEVVTTSEKVKKAQDGVLEFLLVNHPLDCPVCDKGGECPLQDQTLAYGPGESRFVEEKRHFEKPIAISDLVLLDRERCIQCGRCTRFAAEVAGEAQIDFAGRGELVEVAIVPGRPFTSYFSGNTVQICPVGALTATPYRFAARPWDLDQVESTCTTCAFGCRIAVQSSANRLTRLLGIDADPVNHGWLCDKGRFVFESVNGDVTPAQGQPGTTGRLTEPMVRKGDELVTVSWGQALARAAELLQAARQAGGPRALALLGGARLTNEGAYSWAKLMKGVLGSDSVDAQLADGLPAELVLGLPRATIDDACRASAVLLLSGDLREELPVLFLRLRGAVLDGTTQLVELAHQATSLSPYAAASLRLRPGDAPGVARALSGDDAVVRSLQAHPEGPAWSADDLARARELLRAAGSAGDSGLVVVLGRPSLAESAELVAGAARVLAAAWPRARFLPALRRGNVLGALDMGLAPGILPGRVGLDAGREWFATAWGSVPQERGDDAAAVLAALAGGGGNGPVRGLLLVGADPLTDFPDRRLAADALAAADPLVIVASHPSPLLDHADVVLPAATAHERPGTTTNIEGRVSRLGQKLVAPGLCWPDWMIASELAALLGAEGSYLPASPGQVWDEVERLCPAYRGLTGAVLESPGNVDGLVAPLGTGNGPQDRGPEGADGRPRVPLKIDPIALPGVESVEVQGAPPRVGRAEQGEVGGPAPPRGATPPPLLGAPVAEGGAAPATERGAQEVGGTGAGAEAVRVPPPDSYALRLISGRRLYDGGTAVAASPSLARLVAHAEVRAHPYDLDRLGVATGDRVRVRSRRGALELPARADRGLAKGVVAIDFDLPVAPPSPAHAAQGFDQTLVPNAAAMLIEAGAVITEVRLETV